MYESLPYIRISDAQWERLGPLLCPTRPNATLYPDNATESYFHDKVGNLVRTVDPTSIDTTYTYDALRRLLTVSKSNLTSATHGYDLWDNLVSVTDARSHTTTYAYDDFGNVVRQSAPDTGNSTFAYDLADNLVSQTDAKGQTITYAYDALNRILSQSYANASVLFTYDQGSIGRLTSIRDTSGNHTFTYTALGQLSTATRSLGQSTSQVSYGYSNATGELISMTYPSGRVLGISYDASGQINALTLDNQPLVSNISYLPFGPVKSFTAGSLSFTRGFDLRYQVNRIQGASSDNVYTRDKSGKVTGITNLPLPVLAGLNATLGYAAESNRLQSVTGTNAGTYSYDANGNTVSDGRQTFTYDALNRLTAVSTNNTVLATYAYDSVNRRVSKTAGGRTIHYHYDQNNLLIGESLANGTALRDYIYLHGEPVALREYETNPGLYYYVTDHLGTPQKLVNTQGAVVWQAAYLPYGEAQLLTTSVQNNLRFPGQYFDAETGLHYNWNRYYSPQNGRYITADPIGLAGGMNLYAYVGGNPMNAVDFFGLYSWIEFIDDTTNLSAGFGDTITFDGTKWVRAQWDKYIWLDDQDSIDECSFAYSTGELIGYTWEILAYGKVLGIQVNVLSKGNVFKIVSKRLRLGFRLDNAHHGKKWAHPHIWRW